MQFFFFLVICVFSCSDKKNTENGSNHPTEQENSASIKGKFNFGDYQVEDFPEQYLDGLQVSCLIAKSLEEEVLTTDVKEDLSFEMKNIPFEPLFCYLKNGSETVLSNLILKKKLDNPVKKEKREYHFTYESIIKFLASADLKEIPTNLYFHTSFVEMDKISNFQRVFANFQPGRMSHEINEAFFDPVTLYFKAIDEEKLNSLSAESKSYYEDPANHIKYDPKRINFQISQDSSYSILGTKGSIFYLWHPSFSNPFSICGSYTGLSENNAPEAYRLDFSESGLENRPFEFSKKIQLTNGEEVELQSITLDRGGDHLVGIPGLTESCYDEPRGVYISACVEDIYRPLSEKDFKNCVKDFSSETPALLLDIGIAYQFDENTHLSNHGTYDEEATISEGKVCPYYEFISNFFIIDKKRFLISSLNIYENSWFENDAHRKECEKALFTANGLNLSDTILFVVKNNPSLWRVEARPFKEAE